MYNYVDCGNSTVTNIQGINALPWQRFVKLFNVNAEYGCPQIIVVKWLISQTAVL